MNVLIVPDGKYWCAQGVEQDYCAQGSSVENAKANFTYGLDATKKLHMKEFGEFRFVPTPPDVVTEFLDTPGVIHWSM